MSIEATPQDVLDGLARWALVVGRNDDPKTGLVTLPDKSFNHCIQDPPFEKEAHKKGVRLKKGGKGVVAKKVSYDSITAVERHWNASQVHRLTKGWSATFCQVEASHLWREAFEAAGAVYVRTGCYWKDDGQPQFGGDRPGTGWEALVFCWHGGKKMSWNGGGKCAKYASLRDRINNSSKALVDGIKPLKLIKELVVDFTDEGDRILDPYAGAATVLLAATMLNRRSVGYEADPDNFALGQRRLMGDEARPETSQYRCFAPRVA